MSLFDDAMGVAALAAGTVMGQTLTVNAVPVTGVIAGESAITRAYDPLRGGRVTEHEFEVHLSLEAVALSGAQKGSRVECGARRGKVSRVLDLGAGGLLLVVGTDNRREAT